MNYRCGRVWLGVGYFSTWYSPKTSPIFAFLCRPFKLLQGSQAGPSMTPRNAQCMTSGLFHVGTLYSRRYSNTFGCICFQSGSLNLPIYCLSGTILSHFHWFNNLRCSVCWAHHAPDILWFLLDLVARMSSFSAPRQSRATFKACISMPIHSFPALSRVCAVNSSIEKPRIPKLLGIWRMSVQQKGTIAILVSHQSLLFFQHHSLIWFSYQILYVSGLFLQVILNK